MEGEGSGETPIPNITRSMRGFGNFLDYLRRDPASKIPVKLPLDTKYMTTEQFLEYQKRAKLKSRLVADQCRFINGNFEDKRRLVSAKIERFLRALWKEVPPPHLRLEFANVLTFTITYAEFWGWIGETINRDYRLGMKSFLSTDVIQQFGDFFSIIESCQRNTHVETSNFASLLKLRDAVMKNLQEHYRIAFPIFKNKVHNHVFPNHTVDQRYSPYDTEWICGNVISGPNYLSCVKYLCITRLAQLDIACMRADIIAEKEKLDIDFVEGIRVPLPVEATNPKMLGHALYSREFRMKENFRKTKTELFAKLGDDPDLQFVVTHTEFIELRGDIRRKKKNVMDLLVNCERNDFRPFLQIIAVMSTIEAQLLLLLRAAAQFVDKKLGMYGKPLPLKVYKLAIRLFLTTTLESCRSFPLSREITFLLDSLRNETRNYVKDWYNNDEKDCEKVFTEKIDVASMEQKYMMCYELTKQDFTDELDSHVDVMLRYLRLEQIEMERLLCQLCQVKRARYYWPTEGAPEFSLNIHSGTVNAFCTNFDQGMSPEEVATIQRHAEFVLHESTLTTSIGEEIINTAQNIMKELHLVPEGFEITRAFKERFRMILGDELLEGKTSDEVACQVAEIIINDLEMSNARARYGRQGGNSRLCSERVATEVCTKYMAYIANPMPSMRIQIPNDFPVIGESEEESASDETESDYATDEGQMPGHESGSDNESGEDADEGTDDDQTENGSEDGSEEGSDERSENGSEDGTEHTDSDESEEMDEASREALLAAAMFNALTLDANAALMRVANNAIFAQDPYSVLDDYDVVPDELVDAFLFHFQGVNRNIHPDLADVD